MAKRTIVTLPGDGIGNIVMEQALRVLDASGFEADYVNGDIGWELWRGKVTLYLREPLTLSALTG